MNSQTTVDVGGCFAASNKRDGSLGIQVPDGRAKTTMQQQQQQQQQWAGTATRDAGCEP